MQHSDTACPSCGSIGPRSRSAVSAIVCAAFGAPLVALAAIGLSIGAAPAVVPLLLGVFLLARAWGYHRGAMKCTACGAATIPLDTPAGQAIAAKRRARVVPGAGSV